MIDQVDLLANRAFETYAEQVPEIREQFGSGPHPKLEEPFLGYWRAAVVAVLSEYQTVKPLSAIMPDQPKENMKFTKKAGHRASLSRERSLAITKLQEAIMWLGMDLKAQNEPKSLSTFV
jgi:hypothetical protein